MHTNRVSDRPGGSKTSLVVTGGHHTSFGTGQSQHPLLKVSDRRLRFSDWIAGSGKIRIGLGARKGLQLPGQYARKARLGAAASIKPLPKSLGGSVGSPHGKSLDISAIFQAVAALDASSEARRIRGKESVSTKRWIVRRVSRHRPRQNVGTSVRSFETNDEDGRPSSRLGDRCRARNSEEKPH